jgi:purine catabolism regulator
MPIENITTAVNQARTAALTSQPGGPPHRFADMSVFDVILGQRSPEELALMTQPISVLIEHDLTLSNSADSLLKALESFLRHNGHVEGAATELGVHRHTMRNRIAKIAALTEHDLNNADSRAQLLLALRARELLQIDRRLQRGSRQNP